MDLKELLEHFDKGEPFGEDPEIVLSMRQHIQETRRFLFEINNVWHEDETEIAELFSKMTDGSVGKGFRVEPPFYTDFGKNIAIGDYVFINSGCKFQDQGGIYIGDETFVGHNVVMATLDHDIDPEKRHILYLAPIHIGKRVWIGSNVVITKGVTIGDNSVVAAGAVVNRDVPANVVVGGVPATVLKEITANTK